VVDTRGVEEVRAGAVAAEPRRNLDD